MEINLDGAAGLNNIQSGDSTSNAFRVRRICVVGSRLRWMNRLVVVQFYLDIPDLKLKPRRVSLKVTQGVAYASGDGFHQRSGEDLSEIGITRLNPPLNLRLADV